MFNDKYFLKASAKCKKTILFYTQDNKKKTPYKYLHLGLNLASHEISI